MNNIPNCVPEYYRSMWEDECHKAEKELEKQTYYERNKEYRKQKYIDGCNELRFYPDECCKCQYGEEAKPDSEMDDMPTMICSNWKNCPVFRKNTEESFPNVSFEELISWHEEYVEKLLEERKVIT